MESLAARVLEYAGLGRIVFTVYVTKTITSNTIPFYVQQNGTHLNYPNGFYPINTLRNLAIESISTTHCLIADMDMLPSMGLESSINEYAEVLRDHHNMIVLTLFRYNNHSSLSQCYSEGVCDELCVVDEMLRNRWRNAPRNKSELMRRVESGELRFDTRGSQVDNSVTVIIVENDSSRHVGSERVEFITLSLLQWHGGVTQLFIASVIATSCIVVQHWILCSIPTTSTMVLIKWRCTTGFAP